MEELALQALPQALSRARDLPSFKAHASKVLTLIPPEVADHPEVTHDVLGVEALPGLEEGQFRLDFHSHRETIEYICHVLHRDHSVEFPTVEAAHEAFFRVFFGDSWIKVGRAMTTSFGPSSLRILAKMTELRDSAVQTRELLEKLYKQEKRTIIDRPSFITSTENSIAPNDQRVTDTKQGSRLSPREDMWATLPAEKRDLLDRVNLRTTKELRSYINLANRVTAECMREVGVTPTYVDPTNIRFIVDPDRAFLVPGASGVTQGKNILIDGTLRNVPLALLSTTIHEIIHGKSFSAYQETENTSERTAGPRVTQGTKGRHDIRRHRVGLDEAVVQLLTERCLRRIKDEHAAVKEHTDWLETDEAHGKLHAWAKKKGFSPEHVLFIDRKGRRGGGRSYFHLVRGLRFIIESIYNDYSDRFANPDEVANVFGRALFDGNQAPLEPLVEQAFGTGAFDALSSMGTNLTDGQRMMELFQKMRIKHLKSREKLGKNA